MIAPVCQHENRRTNGKTPAGATRYRCKDCGKSWTESTGLFDGMRIGLDRAVQIIEALLEGVSISTATRLYKTDPHTIIDLMVLIGERCEAYMQEHHRNLPVDSIQADEVWSFVGCKKKTAIRLGYQDRLVGDAYCYTAIDRASKLLVCFHFGHRDTENTDIFCRRLGQAVSGRFKLSTDGFQPYESSVGLNLTGRTDYGQIVKMFGTNADDAHHFGSPTIISSKRKRIYGAIEFREICTSHCERMNGTIRNYVKRMTRLTYAFSKKWENHRAALALFFMAYNYCKPHKTLKKRTPAMAHGIADHKWTVREMLLAVSR